MRTHHYALAAVLTLGMAAPAAAQRGNHRNTTDRADVREERRELRGDRSSARELAQLRRDFWDAQRTYQRGDDRRIERQLVRWTRQQVRDAHREMRDEQRELAHARRGHRGPNRYEVRDERGEYRNAQRDYSAWQQAQARVQHAVRSNSLDDSDFVYLQNVTRNEVAEERRELQEARASRRASATRTRVRVRPRQVTPPARTERTYTWTLDL